MSNVEPENSQYKRKSAAHHEMFNSSQAPWGVAPTTGSVPQIKKQPIDPDEMPAAGKKTVYNNSDSQNGRPLGEQSIQELQNELSQQLIQKEQIENEFWRLGNNSRTKQQLEKRQQIERSLELVNTQIKAIKLRLRECGANAK